MATSVPHPPLRPTRRAPTPQRRRLQKPTDTRATAARGAQQATFATFPPGSMWASSLLAVPAAYVAHLSAAQKRAIVSGQQLWLRASSEVDPRLARLSQPVTADDLNHALWVLQSLFGSERAALEGVSLYGALGWASVLLRLTDDAATARAQAVLPLPYYALTTAELDALDLPSEAEWMTHTGRAAPKANANARAKAQTTAQPQAVPTAIPTKRGGRAHVQSKKASATPTQTTGGTTRGGRGGRRPRAAQG